MMYCKSVLASLLGLSCVVSSAAMPAAWEHTLEVRQTPDNSCATGVHLVVGPGQGGTSNTDYGYIGSLVNAIQAAIPGSNNFLIGPYPTGNGLVETEGGEAQMRQYLSDYNAACPDTKIVMIGYSAGAIALMNTLCGASPSPPWTASSPEIDNYPIIAALTYGDETYVAGMPYNAGTCTNNAPNYPRTDSSACAHFYPHMRVYCDSGDGLCCSGGSDPNGHFEYPGKYDNAAAEFIKEQFEACDD